MKVYLVIILCLLIACNLLFGSVDASFFSWNELQLFEKENLKLILFESRIPRTVLALFSGVLCAVSGLVLQTVFRNPLAGPTTLGINSGASLGIALFYFVLSSFGFLPVEGSQALFAVVGALLFLGLIVAVAVRFKSVNTILIVGILLGYVAYSFIEILIQASSNNAISNYVFWGMGSFNLSSWINTVVIGALAMSALFYFAKKSNALNVYLLGEDELKMNGLSASKLRLELIVVTGVLIGVLTSIVGPLAFLGIAVPNFLKLQLKTLNHKVLLPYCALGGGAFAVLGDILSRGLVFSTVFPLNAVLSILAIPIIVVLLLRKKDGVSH